MWKKGWDLAIFVGSLVPSLLFGVAFGNIFQGLPMDEQGYHGTLFTLLNPYGLLTGIFFVSLFIMHGSLWLSIKTKGDINSRATQLAGKMWYLLVLVAVGFLIYTAFATELYNNYIRTPVWSIVPILAVISLFGIKVFVSKARFAIAFSSSCILILMVTFTGIIGLYPNLIPSNIDPHYSLTIFNSSSSPYTLKIMTIVAMCFVPIVIAYQIWMYRIFRHKISPADILEDTESY